MEDFSKTLTRVLAITFAVLFVVSTALAFMLYNMESSMFDAALYIQAFEDEGVYQRLPGLMSQALVSAAQEAEVDNPLVMLNALSQEEWDFYIAQLLPPAELKILADDLINAMMSYVTGESDTVVLSLGNLKTHLSSQQGIDALYEILQAQPDCTAEQLTAMVMGQQNVSLCNPPDTFLFIDLTPLIKAQIKGVVVLMPEQVTLIAPGGEQVKRVRDLERVRLAMRLSPVLPVLFLLLVTAVAVRSFVDSLNWWGYSLLLAGLVSMAFTLLSRPLTALAVQLFITPALPDILPAGVIEIFRDLAATIAYNAVLPTMKTAGMIALIGLGMVAGTLVAHVVKNRSFENR